MTVSLKHSFQSAKSDGPDATLLQPSYWNAEHSFTVDAERLVGNSDVMPGVVAEVGIGAGLDFSGGNLLCTVAAFPIGGYVDFAGTSAPSGWLLMYGQAISRTTYSALFGVLGSTYGSGDGSTTFNLPDARGRVTAGKDNMGGTSADRLTDLTGGVNGDNLGAVGGTEGHVLTEAQLPAVSPTFTGAALAAHGHQHRLSTEAASNLTAGNGGFVLDNADVANYPAYTGALNNTPGHQITGESAGTPAGTISALGDDEAHNNIQPTLIANKIIYTGVV